MKIFASVLVAILTTAPLASAQSAGTLSGKIVDAATYVTSDHNMDSMKMKEHGSSSMSGSMNNEHAMGESMKEGCRTLGVLSRGKLTVVATQMGSPMAAALCSALGKTVTLSGKSYTRGGFSVFLVDSIK